MANITDLPMELLLDILKYLTRGQDLSSLSRCSRSIYWWTSSRLFNLAFKKKSESLRPEVVLMKLVFYAIKHDSQHIIQWLTYHDLRTELNGFVPLFGRKNITYLHLSIIGDAPRVATHLVRHGTDVWEGEGDYPDITPLYLAIAHPQNTRDLDGPLRIACSYALPRTSEHLLARGADPNNLSRFGLAATHLAVMKRLPWRNFALLPIVLGLEDGASVYDDLSVRWSSMLVRTVSTLLRFGGDPNLRSTMSRVHSCGHKCWRSPDCNHRGQGVLHFACGNGEAEVVNLLLEHGADPGLADDEGYLPLFSAICQDHNRLALRLLRHSVDPAKLTIVQPHRSTALHVACHFASLNVVIFLLKRGADANSTDSFGQTPLHEVMAQSCWELEDRVVETLHHLASSGAIPEKRAREGKTAREIAATHLFSRMREMFEYTGNEDLAPDYHHVAIPESNALSAGSSGASRRFNPHRTMQPDRASRVSFPDLSSPSLNQNGIKHTAIFDSVWSDKARTEQLFVQASPFANHLESEMCSTMVRDSGGEGSGAVESVEEFQMSSSASLWSSFSIQPQEPSRPSVESTCEQRKDTSDGVIRRKRRKQKWAPLDFY
ncbi:ankyrin repeat-containing domain protein [Dactylonectria macrodidyma]|uniref:Ankyrin repeat-containing domain protein n=1 Tax=Dactylonectria macrodidyma TaxID=307937 RepID=A0A9P9E775_9HYPO|nr:ankyrin repeat-containing domain protein [Dactylonectria macrodidyma]